MGNVVVIGAQWGDEGKGKVVDWLSERAEIVIRFQGGHNAGHTLVIDGISYRLSLLPAGVLRPEKLSLIGNGVVLDPWALLAEIKGLGQKGIRVTPDNLRISERTSLILPIHRDMDAARERSSGSIGTTQRGIGPAYEDKVGRRALRLIDLADQAVLKRKITILLDHHNALRMGLGVPPVQGEILLHELLEIAPHVLPFADPLWPIFDKVRQTGQRILFEGAQGTMLDIDHGTYPFVTSSTTLAGHAAAGCGISPTSLGFVLGIMKAYCTRVGAGPFPTEEKGSLGQRLGERGQEFGTVTGRKRRCGWFDAVLARQAVKICGIEGIALTKLDVLDGMPELQIATAYHLDGTVLNRMPASESEQARLRPVYESLEGWTISTHGAREWADLPSPAIKYVRRIEELIEAPVSLLSTSPERTDVIVTRDPFFR